MVVSLCWSVSWLLERSALGRCDSAAKARRMPVAVRTEGWIMPVGGMMKEVMMRMAERMVRMVVVFMVWDVFLYEGSGFLGRSLLVLVWWWLGDGDGAEVECWGDEGAGDGACCDEDVDFVADPDLWIGDGEGGVESGGAGDVVGGGVARGVVEEDHDDVGGEDFGGDAGVVGPGDVDGVAGALCGCGVGWVDVGAVGEGDTGVVEGDVGAGALDGAVEEVDLCGGVAGGELVGVGVVEHTDVDEALAGCCEACYKGEASTLSFLEWCAGVADVGCEGAHDGAAFPEGADDGAEFA